MKMKMKVKVGLVLFFYIFLHISIGMKIESDENEQDLIREEDRRAAEQFSIDKKKRGVYFVPVPKHQYSSDTFDYNGYGNSGPSYFYGFPSYHGTSSGSGGLGTYGFHGEGHGLHHVDSYEHDDHEISHQGNHGHSAFGLKSLLIPLAGIALLGAAAALSTNPVLLQLGVLNGRRRRRRRSLPSRFYAPANVHPSNPYVRPQKNNKTRF